MDEEMLSSVNREAFTRYIVEHFTMAEIEDLIKQKIWFDMGDAGFKKEAIIELLHHTNTGEKTKHGLEFLYATSWDGHALVQYRDVIFKKGDKIYKYRENRSKKHRIDYIYSADYAGDMIECEEVVTRNKRKGELK